MPGNPKLSSKCKVEEPVGRIKEVSGPTGKEDPSWKDLLSKALVYVKTVTHQGKADGDNYLGELNRESESEDVDGAAAGEVAEAVGEEGGQKLGEQESYRVEF